MCCLLLQCRALDPKGLLASELVTPYTLAPRTPFSLTVPPLSFLIVLPILLRTIRADKGEIGDMGKIGLGKAIKLGWIKTEKKDGETVVIRLVRCCS